MPGQASGPAPARAATQGKPASDFMVDVTQEDWIRSTPRSTRARRSRDCTSRCSTTASNSAPELLTCLHEEAAVAMAHGYAKAAGKPMLVVRARHGRPAPLVDGALPGLGRSRAGRRHRRPSPQSVRRDQPAAQRAGHGPARSRASSSSTTRRRRSKRFAESAMRAYRIAMTPPMGPVAARRWPPELQESIGHERAAHSGARRCPRRRRATRRPCAKPRACWSNAETPLIQIAEARTHAEGVGSPHRAVLNCCRRRSTSWATRRGRSSRRGIRSTEPAAAGYTPDVTLGLEVTDMSAQARDGASERPQDDQHLGRASVPGQQHPRLRPLRRRRSGDRRRCRGNAALAHRGSPPPDDARAQERDPGARRHAVAAAHKEGAARWHPRGAARLGRQPGQRAAADRGARRRRSRTTTGRSSSGHQFTGDWQRRLLNSRQAVSLQRRLRRVRHRLRLAGVGRRRRSRTRSSAASRSAIVGDGDLNFSPGVLWTAAHHRSRCCSSSTTTARITPR